MSIYSGILSGLNKEASAPISRFLTKVNPIARSLHTKGLVGRIQQGGKGLNKKELELISNIAKVSPDQAKAVAVKASEKMGPWVSSHKISRFLTNPLGSLGTKISGSGAVGAMAAPMLDLWPLVGGVAGGALAVPAGVLALSGTTRGIGRRALESRIASGAGLSKTERGLADLLGRAGKDVKRQALLQKINPITALKNRIDIRKKELGKIGLSLFEKHSFAVDKIQTITPGKTKRKDTGMVRTVSSPTKKLPGFKI